MSRNAKPRNRWLTYSGIALVVVVVLAGMHLAINGNLVGWIVAIHGG